MGDILEVTDLAQEEFDRAGGRVQGPELSRADLGPVDTVPSRRGAPDSSFSGSGGSPSLGELAVSDGNGGPPASAYERPIPPDEKLE